MGGVGGRLSLLALFKLAGFGPTFPAAALTPIFDSPDASNEPNLIGVNPYPGNPNPSVLETLYGEANLRRVDDSRDFAFRHTGDEALVKAVARFNNPSVTERFAFFDETLGNWRTVLEFDRVPPAGLFPVGYDPPTRLDGVISRALSGREFEVRVNSRATSNPRNHATGQDMLVTFEVVGNDGRPDNPVGAYVLAWEYFAVDDLDYQDVVYELRGVIPVPEPTGWLLGTLAFAPVVCRRRRAQ